MEEKEKEPLQLIFKWRYCFGRHVKALLGHQSQRTTDRLLSKLVEDGLLERKRILYGYPSLYCLTIKGKKKVGAKPIKEGIRIERIKHDATILDTLPRFIEKFDVELGCVLSERDLKSFDKYSQGHIPDFAIIKNNEEVWTVEYELTLKALHRLKFNVVSNYIRFDKQIWVIPRYQVKLFVLLHELKEEYSNIEVVILEDLYSTSL